MPKNQFGFVPIIVIILIVVSVVAGGIVLKNTPFREPQFTTDKQFQGSSSATLKKFTPSPKSFSKASLKATVKPSQTPVTSNTQNQNSNQNSSNNQQNNTSNPNQTSSPLPNPTISPSTTSQPITVNKTSINDTIQRSVSSFGQGITITNNTNSTIGFVINIKSGQNGVGIRPISSAILAGGTTLVESFIDTQKPNGVYIGENIIRYSMNGGSYIDGPTVAYTINLVD